MLTLMLMGEVHVRIVKSEGGGALGNFICFVVLSEKFNGINLL